MYTNNILKNYSKMRNLDLDLPLNVCMFFLFTNTLSVLYLYSASCLSGRNAMNYERALAMKQLASLKKSDLRAYLIHFKQDLEAAAREAS